MAATSDSDISLHPDVVDAVQQHQSLDVICFKMFDSSNTEDHKDHAETEPPQAILNLLLCHAIECDHEELTTSLLSGEKYKALDVNKATSLESPLPLLIAARKAKNDLVEEMICKHKADIHMCGMDGLYKGVSGDHIPTDICHVFIKNDDLELLKSVQQLSNQPDFFEKRNLLHLACHYGAYNCVKYFLENMKNKEDVDIMRSITLEVNPTKGPQPDKRTPLMYAAASSCSIVKLLLEYGASVNLVTESKADKSAGSSALHFTANKGVPCKDVVEVLKLLLEAGADVNAMDGQRNTPLHLFLDQIVKHMTWYKLKDPPYDSKTHRQIVIEAIRLLLDHGAGVEDKRLKKISTSGALIHLCSDGEPSVLNMICRISAYEKEADAQQTRLQSWILLRDATDLVLCQGVDSQRLNCLDTHEIRLVAMELFTCAPPYKYRYLTEYTSLLDRFLLSQDLGFLTYIWDKDGDPNTDHHLVVSEILKIFSSILLHGIQIRGFHGIVMLSNYELWPKVLEMVLATLPHNDYNNFLSDLNAAMADEQYEDWDGEDEEDMKKCKGSKRWQYMKNFEVWRSLKGLCRVVINQKIQYQRYRMNELELPMSLVDYLNLKSL